MLGWLVIMVLIENSYDKYKIFDGEKQRSKRQFWKKEQDKHLDMFEADLNRFWKTIGKIGIHDDRKPDIPMEVYDENGNIVGDTKCVLKKWESEFESPFSKCGVI